MRKSKAKSGLLTLRRGIQSVDASTVILEAFMRRDTAQPLSAVAQAAGVPTSTAHRYLVSLQRGGFIVQDPATGLYDLGPAALRIGLAAMRRLDGISLAEQAAGHLTQSTGETSFVSVWSDRGPIIVRWFSGQHPIITTAGIGAVLPILGSSTGRLFAAYLEPSWTKALIQRERKEGHYGVRDQVDLERILERVKGEGFAWIDGLIISGLRGLAAPIFDLQGHIQVTVTLLSVSTSLISFPNEKLSELLAQTKNASIRLGFAGEKSATRG